MKRLGLTLGLALLTSTTLGAVPRTDAATLPPKQSPQAPWRLNQFLGLARSAPVRLLKVGRALYAEERLLRASTDAKLVFEWQDRLAVVGALTDFFDPASEKILGSKKAKIREHARALLLRALNHDPSLLVRDGAVEAIRRVQRMQPGLNGQWAKPLEKAFLDSRNVIGGEGLFIRETILTALREGSHPLTQLVRREAKRDKNEQVRSLLKAWDTSAYQKL